ncbi:PepSY domain-containing protein [Fundicoccus culcitae]|uniref:PepSY domain-containing protein n=1 Tax=Fundicoccus culcitae TaxID=2969821 RepID=A0ABY5P4U0_9LACT|nr:PepSY domain-containing protein [Fundicoccus culcitae]UUX33390.1 hypothetical protein NRE15_10825 [Fundicoccus culcitae]
MTHVFEDQLGIISVAAAIDTFLTQYPNNDINKLQIEYEGPFIKYDMVGNDGTYRHTLEINAQTGATMKQHQKPLKTKDQDPIRRQSKALNLTNLLPLAEINQLALNNAQVGQAFQWEMDRAGQRTVWKVEMADPSGTDITEVKVDAQDGTIVQMKLKT